MEETGDVRSGEAAESWYRTGSFKVVGEEGHGTHGERNGRRSRIRALVLYSVLNYMKIAKPDSVPRERIRDFARSRGGDGFSGSTFGLFSDGAG